jgi:hypothetical protein
MAGFKFRDTPDNITTLAEALRRSPLVKSVKVGKLLKYGEDNKTATAWINVEFTETIKNTTPTGLYTPRRKRTKNGKRDTDGYVYLLEAVGGFYKIGKTVNPKSRKRTFGVKLPMAVEFKHLIHTDNMHKLEKDLHRLFAAKRLRGEFFDLTPADVEFICSLGIECTHAQFTARVLKMGIGAL